MSIRKHHTLPASQGPAGRKAGRAIALASLHAAAAVALACAAVAACRHPVERGLRDQFPYGMVQGVISAGGAIDRPLGVITSDTNSWLLRGVGGPIGTLLVGKTERTGPGDVDEGALLVATRKLAACNPEPQELHARAWARTGSFVQFEPAPSVWGVGAATIAAGAIAWGLLFAGIRAGGRRWQAAARGKRAAAGVCEHCAYPRTSADGVCPECGKKA